MALDGLSMRLFGVYAFPNAYWIHLLMAKGIESLNLAWPLIVIGTTWIGALAGFLLQQSWGFRAMLTLALVSTLYLWWGTILALFILMALALPAICYRLKKGDA